jgi:diguanylate cyclase (GGDEF)-like protein
MDVRNSKAVRSTTVRSRPQAVPGSTRAVTAARIGDALPKSFDLAGFDEATIAPQLRAAFRAMVAEKESLRAELAEARAQIAALEKLVDEDPLMPVRNRRAFMRELSRMMGLAGRYGLPGSVVYFDVNNLKQINDVHGHAAGDAALMQVARVLVESVRATDIVGRLGGDELAVLLVRADRVRAEAKATELAALVKEQPLQWHGKAVPLSVAFGVYAFLGNENAQDVLDAADREMYRHKARRCGNA